MDANNLNHKQLFTKQGKGVYALEGYFNGPSCTMINLATGGRETFGMGGITAGTYEPIGRSAGVESKLLNIIRDGLREPVPPEPEEIGEAELPQESEADNG
jgi:hypothetical protein